LKTEIFQSNDLNEIYDFLLLKHPEPEVNYILTNSLAILGDKKIVPSKELIKESINKLDNYKYPEKLLSFVKIASEKSDYWKQFSFAKIACA